MAINPYSVPVFPYNTLPNRPAYPFAMAPVQPQPIRAVVPPNRMKKSTSKYASLFPVFGPIVGAGLPLAVLTTVGNSTIIEKIIVGIVGAIVGGSLQTVFNYDHSVD